MRARAAPTTLTSLGNFNLIVLVTILLQRLGHDLRAGSTSVEGLRRQGAAAQRSKGKGTLRRLMRSALLSWWFKNPTSSAACLE